MAAGMSAVMIEIASSFMTSDYAEGCGDGLNESAMVPRPSGCPWGRRAHAGWAEWSRPEPILVTTPRTEANGRASVLQVGFEDCAQLGRQRGGLLRVPIDVDEHAVVVEDLLSVLVTSGVD